MPDSAYDVYLQQVADAVEGTGHPRRREVVDDLRIHLAELRAAAGTPLGLSELVDKLGAPDEYADQLGSAPPRPDRTPVPGPSLAERIRPWGKSPRRWLAVLCNAFLQVVFATLSFPIFIAFWHGPFEWGDDMGGTSSYMMRGFFVMWPAMWGISHVLSLPLMEALYHIIRPWKRAGRLPSYVVASWIVWVALLAFGALGD